MAAIRDGYLPLAIETGRLQTPKIPLSFRLCIHCNSGNVEDIHFLFFIVRSIIILVCPSLFKYISNLIPTFSPYLVRFSYI